MSSVDQRLFAVYLGGYAPRCNVELHDMVFAVGESIEALYPALVEKWFLPSYDRLHYDGYQQLDIVDGHQVTLSDKPSKDDKKLFYIYLGGYAQHELNELHKNCFIVDTDATAAKNRARESWPGVKAHKDVQVNIENCIELDQVDHHFIHLQPTTQKTTPDFHLGYHLIPKQYLPTLS